MNLVKVLSTTVDSLQRRVVKALRMGKEDVQTSFDISSYGIDSNPIAGMIAVYEMTSSGQTVIVGYINKNKLAGVGELRLYSTDANGTEKFFAWFKNDGTMQLGGTAHNLVRFTPLQTGLQNQDTAINTELTKIAAAINAIVPGSYIPTPISTNISSAKINEIKTL